VHRAGVWEELNQLYLSLQKMNIDAVWRGGPHAFLRGVQRGAQMLAGVADATMDHGEGWQYLRLGRFLERAVSLAWLLDAHFGLRSVELDGEPTAEDFVAWSGLLRSFSAFEPYCKRYTAELRPQRILSFLLFNAEFPHSVRFCAGQMNRAVNAIAEWTGTPRGAAVRRLAGKIEADLAFGTLEEAQTGDLAEYFRQIVRQCVKLHDAVYQRYISYTVDEVLRDAEFDVARA
jgi:uncharacterized alpha-E superfamily protein